MPKILRVLFWIAVSLLGALALATIALHRGEQQLYFGQSAGA
jgi:hypothetical protein